MGKKHLTSTPQSPTGRLTREALIDSARKLFARIGVEKTTMSDIAKESKRGRRTLYLYFKSKKEVFNAVVSHELELLSIRQQEVANSLLPPSEKLMQLIITHLDMIYDIVMRNGSLKASFFKDVTRLERIRLKLDLSEQALINKILQDGNVKKEFCVSDTHTTAIMLQHAVKGFEVIFINACEGVGKTIDANQLYEAAASLILRGVGFSGDLKTDKQHTYPHIDKIEKE